jgi:hypothetical protein
MLMRMPRCCERVRRSKEGDDGPGFGLLVYKNGSMVCRCNATQQPLHRLQHLLIQTFFHLDYF